MKKYRHKGHTDVVVEAEQVVSANFLSDWLAERILPPVPGSRVARTNVGSVRGQRVRVTDWVIARESHGELFVLHEHTFSQVYERVIGLEQEETAG